VITVNMKGRDITTSISKGGISPRAFASGGWVPGFSGSDRADDQWARLTAGEYVVRRPTARKLEQRTPGFLDALNAGRVQVGGDPDTMRYSVDRPLRFADGGLVRRVQEHLRAQVGEPYIWGGVGPYGADCSGYVGQAYGLLTGRAPYRRYFTTASIGAGQGFRSGRGTFTVGVTAGSGHMAGNLAGLAFEATPPRLRVGGAAASVSSFARQFYLPSAGGVFGGMPGLTDGQIHRALGLTRPRIIAALFKELGVRQYDRGGYLPTGMSVAYNGTGRPERVGGSSIVININGPVYGDERELVRRLRPALRDALRQEGRAAAARGF